MARQKYGNLPQEVDGITFDSKKEARRYGELKLLLLAGKIRNLQTQVRFPLVVNGLLVCTYVADFQYEDLDTAQVVVEDAKGFRTREYQFKKKLMRAVMNIAIKEV